MNLAATFPFAPIPLGPLDLAALLDAHRKNAAALTNANRAAFDGLKTLAQRQSELLKETVDDCSRATSEVLAAPSLQDKATTQADATRDIYIATVARWRELSGIMVQANVAALDILNARIAESLDELRALFAPPAALVDDPVVVAKEIPPVDEAAIAAPVEVEPVIEEASPGVEETIAPVEPEPPVSRAAPSAPSKPRRPVPKGPRRPPSRG